MSLMRLCPEGKVQMQEQNVVSIDYFKVKKRFADLLNGYIYHGQEVIRPQDVQELDSVISRTRRSGTVLRADVNILDLMRKVQRKCHAVLIALQNQTDIHYAMPVRVMNADAIGYYEQWKKRKRIHREAADLKGSAEFLSGIRKGEWMIPCAAWLRIIR